MTEFISTRLFPEILNMSLTGSIVILAVMVIRFFLRKAPKKWSYLLWLVVAFRLACPVALPSPISLMGAVNAPVTTEGTIEYIPQTIVRPQTPAVSPVTPTPGTVTPDTVAPAPHSPSAPAPFSVMDILPVVWLMGMAVVLIYSVVSYLRLRHRLTEAILYHENVWQSDKVHSPFILGLFRPRIYIPFGLDEQTLRYVLAHEHCHLKRKDHIIKPLAFLLLTLHWFNPLCWLAFHLMGRDMEMSCDEQVLAQENGDRKVYSTALLSFAANRRFPAPSPLAFGEGEVRPRITNALNWKAPKVWVTAAAGVLCVAVLLLCALNPNSAPTQVAPGHCTVTHNGETSKYRMKQQSKPFYGQYMSAEYDTLDLPRAAVERDDIITFYVEAEDTPELKVTEYYHYTLDGHEEFHSGRVRTLLREENGGFSLRVYPRGEGTGDYIIYQIQRDEGGYYTFRADISASDSAGAYASVQDFLNQTMAAEKIAYHFTSGVNPDGGAATAPANVTDTKLVYLDKKGECSGLAPKGTLEAWESCYLVTLDVPSEQVVLAGGQYEEDGWYNLDGAFNVIALRYEDGSCDILGYEHQGGDNMDFKGERSYEEALHDWYVKAYGLTDTHLPYVLDWTFDHGSTFARRYDGEGWSIYIPISTWIPSGTAKWSSAYGTGAGFAVMDSMESLTETLQTAQAEGRAITDEGNYHRIDYENSSSFVYSQDGEQVMLVFVCWPDAPSENIYHPSPEQEKEELFKIARSFSLRESSLSAPQLLRSSAEEAASRFMTDLTAEERIIGVAIHRAEYDKTASDDFVANIVSENRYMALHQMEANGQTVPNEYARELYACVRVEYSVCCDDAHPIGSYHNIPTGSGRYESIVILSRDYTNGLWQLSDISATNALERFPSVSPTEGEWTRIRGSTPEEAVQATLNAEGQKHFVSSLTVDSIEINPVLTRENAKCLKNSELAQLMGWNEWYLDANYAAVMARYTVRHKEPWSRMDGTYQTLFHLLRDESSGTWILMEPLSTRGITIQDNPELEQALTAMIQDHYAPEIPDGLYHTQSYTVVDTLDYKRTGSDWVGWYRHLYTVVLNQSYDLSGATPRLVDESHSMDMITVTYTEADHYKLVSYRTPTQAEFDSDPFDTSTHVSDKGVAAAANLSQYYPEQSQLCYEKALAYKNNLS